MSKAAMRWSGVLLLLLGVGLFLASVVQNVVSEPGPYDVVQSAYVGAAALCVAAMGGWMSYREWSTSDRRRVLILTILGGVFLFVLALLAMFDLQSSNVIASMEVDFFLLHFTTLGCLGGGMAGVYYVRSLQATRRATAEQNRFNAILRETPLPIVAVNGDCEVVIWNAAAEEVFSYDAADVLGRPSPIVPPDRREECNRHLDRLRNGDDISGVETTRRRSDGTLLDVELWATSVPDPTTDERYAVFVLRDLSRIKLLKQQRAVLERILRHNLRNELSVIRGYADLLAADGDDEQASRAETIRTAADRLVSLSEHVGRLQRLGEEVATRNVSACVEDVAERARKEHPEATISVETPTESWARAVPLLHDAIREAVENAIVHADAPEPNVSVTVSEDVDADRVKVSVADSGPGIPDTEW
ncbi:MAG: PAS domain S-box protein [Haloferacaceae archaeon]